MSVEVEDIVLFNIEFKDVLPGIIRLEGLIMSYGGLQSDDCLRR